MSDRDGKARATNRPIQCTRRQILVGGGALATSLLASAAGCARAPQVEEAAASTGNPNSEDLSDWQSVREQFDATPELIHMAGMLVATHPRAVRDAIDTYRRGLDESPVDFLFEHWGRSEEQLDRDAEEWAMEAAGRYLDMDHANIALMHNTTTGLAMVYNGIDIRPDQEILTGHWNHWATEGALEYRAQKVGFEVRRTVLYDDLTQARADELVDRLIDDITDRTRVVAVTWVHSVSGLKLPVGEIGRRIEELNRNRDDADRILYCIDGVHGFGVEDAVMADFHCDFFIAGCHKWLFGPRGTGIVAASPNAWQHVTPTVASFSMGHLSPGRRFTPGGFHAFEHRWALNEAFEFHMGIGKARVQERIHGFTRRIMDELAAMDHVRLRTPPDPALTSGIITFEVDGMGTYEVLGHLREHRIVASTTPETNRIPRLSPGLLNDEDDIEAVITALGELRR